MRNRDILIPALVTLIISGFLTFSSCASQSRVQNEDEESEGLETVDGESEEETDEEVAASEEESSEDTELTESSGEESTETAATEETQKEETATTETAESDELDSDNLKESTETASTEEAKPTESTEEVAAADSTDLETDSSEDIAELEGDATASQPTEPSTTSEAGLIGGTDTAVATTPTGGPTDAPMEPVVGSEGPSSSGISDSGMSSSSRSVVSRTPNIPSEPIIKNGATLNRYYILRSGDTASTVASILYGSASESSKLQSWNRGAWIPGRIVYYSSPANPGDTNMDSFYKERNVQGASHTVRSGDWLSRIASQQLGSPDSWKEIAIVNNLSNPDSIEVGQSLTIYERNLSSYAWNNQPTELAQREEPVKEVVQANPIPVETAPQVTPEPIAPPPPVTPVVETAQAPVEQVPPVEPPKQIERNEVAATSEDPGGSLDFAKIFEQNMFVIVIGAGLLLLLVALMVINKRKRAKQASEEFGDDEISPPTKVKRK